MKIILIRHASRVRDPNLDSKDKDLPLTPDGVKEALELADKLASLGLRPTLYLTSRYAHAKQTAEILRDQVAGDSPASVVAMSTLTPHEPYDFEGIIHESEQAGHDLTRTKVVALILHHPRLNQLLGRLTSQPISPEEPKYSEAICLTANSLGAFLDGKGKEDFALR